MPCVEETGTTMLNVFYDSESDSSLSLGHILGWGQATDKKWASKFLCLCALVHRETKKRDGFPKHIYLASVIIQESSVMVAVLLMTCLPFSLKI